MSNRNEQCNCGSGKKFKKCCLLKASNIRRDIIKTNRESLPEAKTPKELQLVNKYKLNIIWRYTDHEEVEVNQVANEIIGNIKENGLRQRRPSLYTPK